MGQFQKNIFFKYFLVVINVIHHFRYLTISIPNVYYRIALLCVKVCKIKKVLLCPNYPNRRDEWGTNICVLNVTYWRLPNLITIYVIKFVIYNLGIRLLYLSSSNYFFYCSNLKWTSIEYAFYFHIQYILYIKWKCKMSLKHYIANTFKSQFIN